MRPHRHARLSETGERVSAEEVIANLRKLDAQLQGPAMKAMLAAAAASAEGFVKVNAQDEFYDYERGQTGNLLASIQSTATADESVVYVGAEYGGYLEMGTSRGIRPRHYVYRGVAEHLPDIRAAAIARGKRILGT
jgi:hypothetical protein